jgi:16S rRNA (uracil1498-N3)-methyltransferase
VVNLILLEPNEIDPDGQARLHDHRAHHIINVLKALPGSQVRVGVIDGGQGVGTVIDRAPDGVTLQCTIEPGDAAQAPVDLLLALPRPKVLRRLWAQIAALGAGRIIVTNAEKVERNYFDTHVLTEACYRPLLVEGLQQARDTRLPVVSIHRQFRVLIEDHLDALFPAGLRLVADPVSDSPLVHVVRKTAHSRVLIAIGPEGGWNAFERQLLARHGFETVGIGRRALRTDTATIALLALTHAALA